MTEKNDRPLTPPQERFCLEYCRSGNASEAYRVAYPRSQSWKPEAVWTKASILLTHGKVAERVKNLQSATRQIADEQFEFGVTEILREAVGIATSDLAEIVDDSDDILPLKQWPKRLRRAVASLKIKPEYRVGKDGKEFIGYSKEVRFWDKNSALDKLMRINGMFEKDNNQKNPFANLPREQLRAMEALIRELESESVSGRTDPSMDASPAPSVTH